MTKKFLSSFTLVLLICQNVVAMDDVPCGPAKKPTSFVHRTRSVTRLATTATMALLLAGTVGAQDLSKPTCLAEPSDGLVCANRSLACPMACQDMLNPLHAGEDQWCQQDADGQLGMCRDPDSRRSAQSLDFVDECDDISMTDQFGEPSLTTAAFLGKHALVARLLRCGANINAADEYNKTAAYQAANMGYAETLQLLACCGADLAHRDKRDWSPLDVASKNNNHEAVALLLRAGADPDAKGSNQRTALHEAARYGVPDTAEQLLACGADPNARDHREATPLHDTVCMRGGGHGDDVVPVLLAAGADLEAKNNVGRTPLVDAVMCRNIRAVAQLIAHGADAHIINEYGGTLLHSAVGARDDEMVELLLEHGLDPNASGEDGVTPLLLVVSQVGLWGRSAYRTGTRERHRHEPIKVVQVLLDHGADINAQDSDGDTALHLIALSGCQETELVKLLLARGANPYIQNNACLTPRMAVRMVYGYTQLLELLPEGLGDEPSCGTHLFTAFALRHRRLMEPKPVVRCIDEHGRSVAR